MEIISIIGALVLSVILGISMSAAGLHMMLTFMPGRQKTAAASASVPTPANV